MDKNGQSILFNLLSLFWKNKSRLIISPCCLCIPPPINFLIAWTNLYETWYVNISWHLNPSQRRTSKIPLISPCVCMCIPLIVARQRLGKHVPMATNTRNIRNVGGVIFYAVRVVSKESRRLIHIRRRQVTDIICRRDVGWMNVLVVVVDECCFSSRRYVV
jgi:hypothetical protein